MVVLRCISVGLFSLEYMFFTALHVGVRVSHGYNFTIIAITITVAFYTKFVIVVAFHKSKDLPVYVLKLLSSFLRFGPHIIPT